jgi:hypothetical protein
MCYAVLKKSKYANKAIDLAKLKKIAIEPVVIFLIESNLIFYIYA